MRSLGIIAIVAVLVAGCAAEDATTPATATTRSAEATVTRDTGAVEGLVKDPDASPLAGAGVALEKDILRLQTNTSVDGRFVFSGLVAGEYTLFVQKLGYDSHASKVNVTAGEVSSADVVLVPFKVGPDFPIELTVHQVRTMGVWLQVPYAEAQKRIPAGFRAKPHVLLDPNDQTAEYSVYVTSYKNGTLGTRALGEGYWAFEVFSVDPPSKHASGATVDFILAASYASDPEVQALFGVWNLPTSVATISLTPGEAGPSTFRSVSTVKHEKGTYTATATNTGNTDTVAGTSLSVRLFGVVNQEIKNYVDIAIGPVLYSISGAGNVDGSANLAVNPSAPAGESYVQWGPTTREAMLWQEAKP